MPNSPSPWHQRRRAALLALSLLVAIGLVASTDPARAAQLLPVLAAAAAVSLHGKRAGTAATCAGVCLHPTQAGRP